MYRLANWGVIDFSLCDAMIEIRRNRMEDSEG